MVHSFSFLDRESEPFQDGPHFTAPDVRFAGAKVVDDGGDSTTHMTPQVVSVQKISSKSISISRQASGSAIMGRHHTPAAPQ